MREILLNKEVAGEIVKNVSLGVFINGLYGISDGSVEIFNLLDMGIGFVGMIIGILLERIK